MIPRVWAVLAARRTRRVVFWVYAITLATLTHWPALTVDVPEVPRPDLFIHVAAFFLFGVLLIGTSYFGPAWYARRNIMWCVPIGIAYGAIDEATQAIPVLQRHAAIEDFLANALGVIAAGVTVRLISSVPAARRLVPEPGDSGAGAPEGREVSVAEG